MIFTSPSSARGNLDTEEIPRSQGKRRKIPSKRPSVAEQLKMGGQVTAHAIAYAAVQVCRSGPSSIISPPTHILSSILHSTTPPTGWVITTDSTMKKSTSLLLTFLKKTKRPKERPPPASFLVGGISASIIPYPPLLSLTTKPQRPPDVCFHNLLLLGDHHRYQQDDRHSLSYDSSVGRASALSFGWSRVQRQYLYVRLVNANDIIIYKTSWYNVRTEECPYLAAPEDRYKPSSDFDV